MSAASKTVGTMATPATKKLWGEYVNVYHDFWDYLERHEELLQRESSLNWLSNINKVCRVMEECPVVNFSCVRDLIYTMRQFLGEKRFREQEREWRERLQLKVEECIRNISRKEGEERLLSNWLDYAKLNTGLWVAMTPFNPLRQCL